MSKQFREQIRVDMLTSELLFALIDKQNKKVTKSEIYRKAVYRMAKEELTEEEFTEVINNVMDLERI